MPIAPFSCESDKKRGAWLPQASVSNSRNRAPGRAIDQTLMVRIC